MTNKTGIPLLKVFAGAFLVLLAASSVYAGGAKYTYTTDVQSFCDAAYKSVTFKISEMAGQPGGFNKNQAPCCKDIVLELQVVSGTWDIEVGTGSLVGSTWGDLNDMGDIPTITTAAGSITIGNLHLRNDNDAKDEQDEFNVTVNVRCTFNGQARIRRNGGGTFEVDGATNKPSNTEYLADLTRPADMTYTSSTTTQGNTNDVSPATNDAEIIGIEIVTAGSCSPVNATQFDFNTVGGNGTGTDDPATNLTNAKLWTTGASSVFATTTQVGATQASPNGPVTFSGFTQALVEGTNYFWLTYDVAPGANVGEDLDARCNTVTMDGGVGAQTPTVSNPGPVGKRTISAYFTRLAGGNWNATATWSTAGCGGAEAGSLPSATDNCVICTGDAVLANTNTTVNSITVQTGGSITPGGGKLTITNDLDVQGTGTLSVDNTLIVNGNATFQGSGASTTSHAMTYNGNLNVLNTASLTATGTQDMFIKGDLKVDGTLAHNDPGGKQIILDGASPSNISGNGIISSTNTTDIMLDMTTSNKTFPLGTDLKVQMIAQIDVITCTNNGTVEFDYDLLKTMGDATWTQGASSIVKFAGAVLSGGGIINASASGNWVEYDGAGAQTILTPSGAPAQFHHLTISNAGTKTQGAAFDLNGNLSISGTAVLDAANNNITLAGNWDDTNTGGDGYTEGTGTVTFDGAGAKTVNSGSTNDARFYNLSITGGGDVTQSANTNIIVTNNLTLTSGDIIPGLNDMEVSVGATISGGSASSYVHTESTGTLRKLWQAADIGSTFTFPVGDATNYSPFTITFNAGSGLGGSNLTVKIVDVKHPEIGPGADYITRYWLATPTGITTPDYDYRAVYIDADIAGAEGNIVSAKWDGVGWVQHDAAETYGANTLGHNNVTAFSDFTGGTNGQLPIELLYFNTKLNGTYVDLKWATATEINNDYFTVEKSQHGIDFEEVASIDGAGNSNETLEYTAVDENPYGGISYYRLKQTDFDGKFTYSQIVAVEYNPLGPAGDIEFAVYPNPSNGTNINVKSMQRYLPWEEILVVVTDINGREFYSKVVLTDDTGDFFTAIDPYQKIPPGVYVVMGSSNDDIYTETLVVE